MTREIRRVPRNWEHPILQDECSSYYPMPIYDWECPPGSDYYQPMYDKTYIQAIAEHVKYELPYCLKHPRHLREWFKEWPNRKHCHPRWRKREANCYQIYETVSEGTPISPVFESLAGLTNWLVDRQTAESFDQRRSDALTELQSLLGDKEET